MNKVMRVVASVGVGGSLGAAGVMGARVIMPSWMGLLQKIPLLGPKIAASPGAQQFIADMTVGLFAAPGVVAGVAFGRGKSVNAAIKEGIKEAVPVKV